MKDAVNQSETSKYAGKGGIRAWVVSMIVVGLLAGGFLLDPHLSVRSADHTATPLPPVVSVSAPIQRDLESRLQFLGQFSAVEQVELRAQVGGTLAHIGFKDGDIV